MVIVCSMPYAAGSLREYSKLRSLIVEHMRSPEAYMTILVNYTDEVTIEEYIEASHINQDGAWGTTAEILHMLEANIASYNSDDKRYPRVQPGSY